MKMPNWCENRVYLEASPAEIEAIIMAVQSDGDKGLLNYLRPEPEHGPEIEGEMPNWWNWRVDNWGTKWEVHAEVVSHGVSDGWINLAFDSAGSPPLKAFYAWEEADSGTRSFNIRYIEGGMAFCGEADSRGINDHYNIPMTVAAVQQEIPVELDEEFGISDTIAQWEEEELDDSMDGDHESALASAGWGTDEDYGG
jgi:hypothetical protein